MVLPRITISGLRGGSGKTILSAGLAAALAQSGEVIIPFKKGPDYIDAGWLALAAGRPCHNLDTFLVDQKLTLASFIRHAQPDAISVIEGNRGLFDSIDPKGATSTAHLAKLLISPVILVIDCTKSTRTVAAMVMGCSYFDPEVDLRGIVLNRVAGARHEANLRKNIETYTGIAVVGSIPKLPKENFPERHMGLVPTAEHGWAKTAIDTTADMVKKYVDVQAILSIAKSPLAPAPDTHGRKISRTESIINETRPVIGVVRDSAFQFYYPENIQALEDAGAEVVSFSLVSGEDIPKMAGLYIGGGFPETHAEKLAQNQAARDRIRELAKAGMPIYAECGGLMYLGKDLVYKGNTYPMAGVLPIVFGFSKKPMGHGYTLADVQNKNPFFETGTQLKGHEFHYSKILQYDGSDADLVFSMARGKGFANKRDGVSYKNVLATYTHIHALGTPQWAPALVRLADQFTKNQ